MEEIHNFLTQEECQELIKMIDANHTRSSVVEGGTDRTAITDYRTSSTSNLEMNNKLVSSIHKKIADYLKLDINKGEALQGQLYEVGQYFKPHNDFFTGAGYDMHCKVSGNRTHTLMIYLNEDFKGGGTHFPTLEKTVVPETGKALWWYNLKNGEYQPQYMHEGVAVEEGKKYIVTSWWRENKWDGPGDDFPKFTENGFHLMKCPEDVWGIINDAYTLLKEKNIEENFQGKDSIIVGGGSELLSFDTIPSIRNYIHNSLKQMHVDWSGQNLEPSFVYGIRSYLRNATLTPHVDRIATHHISSIIIVDKDLACGCTHKPESDDWPLDIQGHDGDWYKIYAQPGDIILYESAKCKHGRVEPFGGTYFRNFYVHYKLTDWKYVG
jgi:prolyl 4-hydroxylase